MNELTDEQIAEDAENLIINLASKNPQKAMATLCGLLVGLMEYQAELQGFDASEDIKIEPDGNGRTITIHALKKG